jgi:hypothetical protein
LTDARRKLGLLGSRVRVAGAGTVMFSAFQMFDILFFRDNMAFLFSDFDSRDGQSHGHCSTRNFFKQEAQDTVAPMWSFGTQCESFLSLISAEMSDMLPSR